MACALGSKALIHDSMKIGEPFRAKTTQSKTHTSRSPSQKHDHGEEEGPNQGPATSHIHPGEVFLFLLILQLQLSHQLLLLGFPRHCLLLLRLQQQCGGTLIRYVRLDLWSFRRSEGRRSGPSDGAHSSTGEAGQSRGAGCGDFERRGGWRSWWRGRSRLRGTW